MILAGGQARRMGGGDKTLLDLAGQPLLAHVIARLRPQVDALAISANGDAARFAAFGLPVIPDDLMDQGPLGGVLAGLDWAAARGFDAVATVPGDTPAPPADLVPQLYPGPAYAAGPDQAHPLLAVWPVGLAAPLRVWLNGAGLNGPGSRSVRRFLHGVGARVVPFPDEGAFRNLNTPEDLAAARQRITSFPD